ncbi:MAG: hypothetical protein JNK49_13950 [Planctomycetes bacterium]|nr:hypothetical protein [Planctomycetota bacterium]
MTDFATLQTAAQAASLPLAGPFPTPSAATQALLAMPADAVDEARFVAVRLAEGGMAFVGGDGQGLPAEITTESLAALTDRRERGDLLAAVRAANLPATFAVLWDTENLAYFPSPGAAAAWLLRRRRRGHELEPLYLRGLWVTRGERAVVVVAPDEAAVLQGSFLLRQQRFLPQFVRDHAGDHLPFPKAIPPFDLELAKQLAKQLRETQPGPRRSVAKYVAYLGPHRCQELADLAVMLHQQPELPLMHVHEQLAAAGWDAAALAAGEPPFDPRVSVHGPRTLGGVWFQLVGKWVGPRLAAWIERQP